MRAGMQQALKKGKACECFEKCLRSIIIIFSKDK